MELSTKPRELQQNSEKLIAAREKLERVVSEGMGGREWYETQIEGQVTERATKIRENTRDLQDQARRTGDRGRRKYEKFTRPSTRSKRPDHGNTGQSVWQWRRRLTREVVRGYEDEMQQRRRELVEARLQTEMLKAQVQALHRKRSHTRKERHRPNPLQSSHRGEMRSVSVQTEEKAEEVSSEIASDSGYESAEVSGGSGRQ